MRATSLKILMSAFIAAVACFGLGGCAGQRVFSESSRAHYESLERIAGDGESEIVVVRQRALVGSAVRMYIFLNGQNRLGLKNEQSATIVVPNGRHVICGKYEDLGGFIPKVPKDCSINAIVMELTSERAVVYARKPSGHRSRRAVAVGDTESYKRIGSVELTNMAVFPLGDSDVP